MHGLTGFTITDRPVFGPQARVQFAAAYPETPVILRHDLADHPLLTLDALAALAGKLPDTAIEYNRGDLPLGVDGKPGPTGIGIEDTIRHIAISDSWAVLRTSSRIRLTRRCCWRCSASCGAKSRRRPARCCGRRASCSSPAPMR